MKITKLNRPFVKMPDKYEKFVKKICGAEWKHSSVVDLEGGLGVAICKAIIDGQHVNLVKLSEHLGIDTDVLSIPYERLSKNGYMKSGKLSKDEELVRGDLHAWCYVAGTASGITGTVQ